jgi:hypothetical protein
MWKNIVESGRSQMTVWRMRIACCVPKAADRHSEYVTHIAFPQQQWLHERSSLLHYRYTACIVVLRMSDWTKTSEFIMCCLKLSAAYYTVRFIDSFLVEGFRMTVYHFLQSRKLKSTNILYLGRKTKQFMISLLLVSVLIAGYSAMPRPSTNPKTLYIHGQTHCSPGENTCTSPHMMKLCVFIHYFIIFKIKF